MSKTYRDFLAEVRGIFNTVKFENLPKESRTLAKKLFADMEKNNGTLTGNGRKLYSKFKESGFWISGNSNKKIRAFEFIPTKPLGKLPSKSESQEKAEVEAWHKQLVSNSDFKVFADLLRK